VASSISIELSLSRAALRLVVVEEFAVRSIGPP
jgi:hypothetical protein